MNTKQTEQVVQAAAKACEELNRPMTSQDKDRLREYIEQEVARNNAQNRLEGTPGR